VSDASHRISVEEAAQRLGLSRDEVVALRRNGKIRGYPDYGDWVFEESDVAELAAEMGIAPLETPQETPAPETDPTPGADADSEPVTYRPLSEEPSPYEPSPYEPSPYKPTPYEPAAPSSESPDETDGSSRTYVPAPVPGTAPPPAETQPVGPAEAETADQSDAPKAPPKRPTDPPVEVVTLEELARSDQPISSARLIAALAARHETGFHEAAAVVDGFWDHLLDPRHYRRGKGSLVMPHFGTFSLKRNKYRQTELRFKSRPRADLRERRAAFGTQRPSTNWIDHWQRHPPSEQRLNALSLKRRLAVAIADETGLDLPTTFLILWDLVETITGIMTGSGTEIRWAKRGVMRATSDRYSFRTYKRLADTLPELPAPQRSSSSHRSRSQSGGSSTGCATTLLKVMFYVGLTAIVILINAAIEGY